MRDRMGIAIGGPLLYLYGVVDGDRRPPRSDLARLEAIVSSGLAAIVEEVAASDFGAEVLEQRLQDIGSVAPLARKHEYVLEDIIEHGVVIPAPLCTLFSSGDAVRDSLVANGERLRALLTWLEGRREWGLKLYCRTRPLPGELASSDDRLRALERALGQAGPGQAFLLRKRRERRIEELASERVDHAVDEVLRAIDPIAVSTRFRPLPRQPAIPGADTMVLNAAFLVDVSSAAELQAIGAELSSGLEANSFAIELTGPWPPYSFCDDTGLPEPGADGEEEE
jgi:hypothetical protein